MNKLINHFKLWNEWRKGCLNGPLHKFLVLIGLVRSPTFHLFKTFKDWNMCEQFNHLCAITPRVAYICDRKFCEECSPECNHCFDIRHAKNFECIADNEYFEKEEIE